MALRERPHPERSEAQSKDSRSNSSVRVIGFRALGGCGRFQTSPRLRPVMVRRSTVLLVAFLAGCADRTAPPAPIELHTHAGQPVLSEPVPAVHPDRITVANADT